MTNYDALALAWAKHLDQPFPSHGREVELSVDLMNALWVGIAPETIEDVLINPHRFSERVAVYRHSNHEKGAGE